MKRLARFISAAGIVALGLAAAPSWVRAGSPDAPAQPSDKGAAEGKHGEGKLIEKALDEVQLRPDQKSAIEAMKDEARERHAAVKAAKAEFVAAIADQLEQGKTDRCALASKIDALASATAQAHPGDRADFEQLHSLLDPAQRITFVDALQRQWESVKAMHRPAALVDEMGEKLDLTSAQRASLEQILIGLHEVREAEPWHAKHRERWTKILDAFKGDQFVLDEVAPMGDVAAHTRARVEHGFWEGEAILPVLDADQRRSIAGKMRDWAKKAGPVAGSVSPSMSPSED